MPQSVSNAGQSQRGDRCDFSEDGSTPSEAAGSSHGWSSSSTQGIDPGSSVILALEYLADGPTRLLVLLQRAALLGGTGLLVWELAIKLSEDDRYLIESNSLVYVNITVACLGLLLLLSAGVLYALRIIQANLAGRRWSQRRKRVVILYSVELVLQIINLGCFLGPNAYVLAVPCGWFMLPLFVLSTVHAHNLTPVGDGTCCGLLKGRLPEAAHDGDVLVMDLPWLVHLPKLLLLWLPCQVVVILIPLALTGVIGDAVLCTNIDDQRCFSSADPTISNCRERVWDCFILPLVRNLVYAQVAVTLLIISVYLLLVVRAWRELGRRSYAQYRVGNVHLRVMDLHTLTARKASTLGYLMKRKTCTLGLVNLGSCTCYMEAWLGFTPMQLVASCLVFLNTLGSMPVAPDEKQLLLHTWLQDFAWLESDLPAKLRRRPVPPSEPMFCFESALKLLYWCHYVYLKPGAAEGALPTALGLYKLQSHDVFWARRHDTKCCIAWREGLILVAFRGTQSLANVKADIKAWRAVHPPKRGSYWLGTRPMVHRGFLECYTAEGLDAQVLEKVESILMNAEQDGSKQGAGAELHWRVVVTGHSLGGALATLAALELQHHLTTLHDCPPVKVSLYTFGAPRPGNRAFARDFAHRVPDAWDIIHSDDAVASQGKFLVLYKRAAHRVILTAQADLVVRPSYIEASVRRGPGFSIHQHLLTTYARTMASIISAQLGQHKGRGGGREAVQQLLSCPYVQALLHSTAGLPAESFSRLSLAGSSSSTAGKEAEQLPGASNLGRGSHLADLVAGRSAKLDSLEKGYAE
ncbi:hypothetical protein N2152v2_002969 [Parachlorella kessleri]